MVDQADQRQEQGDNDAADYDCEEHDHDRLQQGSHGGNGVVHLIIVVVGNLHQHFRQRAGLLAHIHHADDHRREYIGRFQRRGNGLAFLDAFVNRRHGFADDDVAGRFFNDCQCLQDGDAAAHQCAQCSGKARDRHLADHGAENREVQLQSVKQTPSEFRSREQLQTDEKSDD